MSASSSLALLTKGQVESSVTVVGSYLSPYVRKVLACVRLKDLTYEIDPIVPFYGNADFKAHSPLRRIPLLFHEGHVINDSSVICEYLNDRFPNRGAPLYPAEPHLRAEARWVEELADTRICEVNIWGLWNEDVPPLADYCESKLMPRTTTSARKRVFLFGEQPMAADIALAASFRNLELAGDDLTTIFAPRWPLWSAYLQRVLRHDCLAAYRHLEEASARVKPSQVGGYRAALAAIGAPISVHVNLGTEPKPTL